MTSSLAAADIVRYFGMVTTFPCAFAHRARCAATILAREMADRFPGFWPSFPYASLNAASPALIAFISLHSRA